MGQTFCMKKLSLRKVLKQWTKFWAIRRLGHFFIEFDKQQYFLGFYNRLLAKVFFTNLSRLRHFARKVNTRKNWESRERDPNPWLPGEKRKRFLCALPTAPLGTQQDYLVETASKDRHLVVDDADAAIRVKESELEAVPGAEEDGVGFQRRPVAQDEAGRRLESLNPSNLE